MNINDVSKIPQSSNYLKDIFKRQWELIDKYHDIEHQILGIEKLNIHPKEPINLSDPIFQYKVKGHIQRVLEEIAESYEVVQEERYGSGISHFEHQVEESVDALHFLTETMIMVHIEDDKLPSLDEYFNTYNTFEYNILSNFEKEYQVDFMYNQLFYHVSIPMNIFKNKVWKRTQMRTDEIKFQHCMKEAYKYLIYIFYFLGLKPVDIYEIYFKKSEVNRFRIRTQY